MIPASWASLADWQRMVALQVNPLLQGYPYLQLGADPTSTPAAGFTYFNTSTGKVRTWDGSAWNNHY